MRDQILFKGELITKMSKLGEVIKNFSSQELLVQKN
jgi:hypothetical protein